jgi:hypothetical protein
MRPESLVDKQTFTPFDLSDDRSYTAWREQKLAHYPQQLDELVVTIDDPRSLTPAECQAIRQACGRANMAIYSIRDARVKNNPDTAIVAALGRHFGLQHLDQNLYAEDDGISALQVSAERRQYEYIPYSHRAISWHTDGYYNPPERKIRAMVLHCVRAAATGGENALIDHEILYLLLRDENPDYIAALMQPDAMTIPANIEQGVEIRAEQSGPVFSVDEYSGHLHMRYTARTRSIVWKQDPMTQAAVKYLEQLLAADSPYVFRRRLEAGQGIICNNVLHTRTAFENGADLVQQRLVYRARYYDRVQ